MFRLIKPYLLLTLASMAFSPYLNAKGQRIDDCIDLSPEHQLKRNGSQFLYVENGDDYYRLSFDGGSCSAMNLTQKLRLTTDEVTNRICPEGTLLFAKSRICQVNGIERLEKDDFDRLTRNRR